MITRQVTPHGTSNRRGAALVEFAVLLPLLMLLFVGSIEVGRAINVRQTLCEASRAGARVYSMQTKKTSDDAVAIVDEIMRQAGLANYTVTLDPPPGTTVAQLDPMTVTVTMSAADASWYPTPWFLGRENTLRAVCVMPADLEESAPGEALDTGESIGRFIDSDVVAELSGSDNASVQLLEAEAQRLVEEARLLREAADAASQNAEQALTDAGTALQNARQAREDEEWSEYFGFLGDLRDHLRDYASFLGDASDLEEQAVAAEEAARVALSQAAAAST